MLFTSIVQAVKEMADFSAVDLPREIPDRKGHPASRSALFHSGRRFNVHLITIAAITFPNTNIEYFLQQSPKTYQLSWFRQPFLVGYPAEFW